MKWITRERPKVDRIACPWLIARFIDDALYAWCRRDAHTWQPARVHARRVRRNRSGYGLCRLATRPSSVNASRLPPARVDSQ